MFWHLNAKMHSYCLMELSIKKNLICNQFYFVTLKYNCIASVVKKKKKKIRNCNTTYSKYLQT